MTYSSRHVRYCDELTLTMLGEGQPTLEVDAEVTEGESTTVRCKAEVGAQPFKLLDKALVPHISLQVFHDVIVANETYYTDEVDGRIVNYVVAVRQL